MPGRYLEIEENSEIPISQEWFIERMKKLGYRSDHRGMCYGLARMASQAVQCGIKEYALFKERLRQIALIPTEDFSLEMEIVRVQRIALFQQAKQRAKEELELTSTGNALTRLDEKIFNNLANQKFTQLLEELPIADRARLTIDNFLDGAELYMQPEYYPELFENQVKHGCSQAAMMMLLPPQLEQKKLQGELPSNIVFSGSYRADDLYEYLRILQQQLKECQHPVSLHLNSTQHSICLIFDPSRDEASCWSCFDPNFMKDMDDQGGPEQGDNIEQGFGKRINSSFMAGQAIEFSTSIAFASHEDKHSFLALSLSLTENVEWRNMHNPKEYNSDWLTIAILHGDIHAVKTFLDLGFNISEKGKSGLDYLEKAIDTRRLDIIKLFLERMPKIDLHLKYLARAISWGNLELVKLFLKAGFNPLEMDPVTNKSPLHVAEEKASLPENKNTVYQEIYEAITLKAELILQKDKVTPIKNKGFLKTTPLEKNLIDAKTVSISNEPEGINDSTNNSI